MKLMSVMFLLFSRSIFVQLTASDKPAKSAFVRSLFSKFIELYNDSIEELGSEIVFKEQLEEYIGRSLTDKDMGDIKNWKLKFLQIK